MNKIPISGKDRNNKMATSESNSLSENQKQDQQTYREERRALDHALLEQSKSFDKYILTIASGSFGLSLLFIRELVPIWQHGTLYLLILSWISFAVSIIITLISFLISQFACLRQISVLDNWLSDSDSSGDNNSIRNPFIKTTHILNWLSMVAFLSGVSLLIIFASVNLSS